MHLAYPEYDRGYRASSNRGHRGGYGSGRGGFSGSGKHHDGPPASKKARYNGPLCDQCHPKGFVATHPFAECRKHAQSLKRESVNTSFPRSNAATESNFLNSPNVEFGLMNVDCGSSLHHYEVILLDNPSFYADSDATAHCTHLRHLLRNIFAVPKSSWVIQGFRGAQADVEAYGDIVYEATVNGQKRVDILRRVLYAPNTGINFSPLAKSLR